MNQMQLLQMFRSGGNPQQIIRQMIDSNPNLQNEVIENAYKMASQGNFKGVEEIARNVYKEKNADIEKPLNQFKSFFNR